MSIVPIHRRGANVAADAAALKHRRRDAAEPSNRRRQVPILLRLPDLTADDPPHTRTVADRATPDWATIETQEDAYSGAVADHAPRHDTHLDPPTIDDAEFDDIDSDTVESHTASRSAPASSRPNFGPVRIDRPGRGATKPAPSPAMPTSEPPAAKKPFAVKRQQLATRREDTPQRWWFEPVYLIAAIFAIGAIIIAGCWLMRKAALPTHVATPPLWNGVLPGQAPATSPLAGQAVDDTQSPAGRSAATPVNRSTDGESKLDGAYRTAERGPAMPTTTYGPSGVAPQNTRPEYEPRRAAPVNEPRRAAPSNESQPPAAPYFWPPGAPNQTPLPAPQAPLPGTDETTDAGRPGTARLMGTIDLPTMRAQNERIGSGVY